MACESGRGRCPPITMNIVDLVLIGLFLFAIADGLKRGFLYLSIDLLVLLVSITLALVFDEWAGKLIAGWFGLPAGFERVVGFFLVFCLSEWATGFLLRTVYRLLPPSTRHSLTNRVLGVLPALTKQLILVFLLINLTVALPVVASVGTEITESRFGRHFIARNDTIQTVVRSIVEPAVREVLRFITTTERDGRPIPLSVPSDDWQLTEGMEQQLVERVNKERGSRGLSTLQWDASLAGVARAHSDDMIKRQYFAHVNPDGESAADRADRGGVSYTLIAENLAVAPNVEVAHTGLMESQGHRENILHADVERIGVGVYSHDLYGIVVTELFAK